MPYGITNVNAVVSSDHTIRSTTPNGKTVWFYRVDNEWVAQYGDDGGRHTIDRATVERNVDHDHTDIDTVPVGESPFADVQ